MKKLILFFALLLVPSFALATNYYDTGFEDFSLGALNGQNTWTAGGSASVQNSLFYDGAKAVDTLSSAGGEIYFPWNSAWDNSPMTYISWWYRADTSWTNNLGIWLIDNSYNGRFSAQPNWNDEQADQGRWNYILVEVDNQNQLWRMTQNASTSAWYAWSGNPSITKIYFTANGISGNHVYLDDFTISASPPAPPEVPPASLSDSYISPIYPPTATSTSISTGVANLTGTYGYPTSTDFFVSDIQAVFTDSSTSDEYVFNLGILDSATGTYSIPIQLLNGNFDLTYRFVYNTYEMNVIGGQYLSGVPNLSFYFHYPPVASSSVFVSSSTLSSVAAITGFAATSTNPIANIFTSRINQMLNLQKHVPWNYIGAFTTWFFSLEVGTTSPLASIGFHFKSVLPEAPESVSFIDMTTPSNATSSITGEVLTWSEIFRFLSRLSIIFGLYLYYFIILHWIFE